MTIHTEVISTGDIVILVMLILQLGVMLLNYNLAAKTLRPR